jgi:hypothetical protein
MLFYSDTHMKQLAEYFKEQILTARSFTFIHTDWSKRQKKYPQLDGVYKSDLLNAVGV